MDLPPSFLDLDSLWINDHDVDPPRFYPSWPYDDPNHSPRLNNGVKSYDPDCSVFVGGTSIPRATAAQDIGNMQRFLSDACSSEFGIGGRRPGPDMASHHSGVVVSPTFRLSPDVGFVDNGAVASPTASGSDDRQDVDPRSLSYGPVAWSDRASEVGLSSYGGGGSNSSHEIRRPSRQTIPFGVQTSSEVSLNMVSSQGSRGYLFGHSREADRNFLNLHPVHQNAAVIHSQAHSGADGPYSDGFLYLYDHQREATNSDIPEHADAVTDPNPTTTTRTQQPPIKVEGSYSYQQIDGNAFSGQPHTPSTTSGREQSQSRRSSRVTKPKPRKQCAEHPNQTFKNTPDWKRHLQKCHQKPFRCILAKYDCPSVFGSKNEWKRHINCLHLRLGFWRCDYDACNQTQRRPGPERGTEVQFKDFNRKDLFTQHLRRLHCTPEVKGDSAKLARWNEDLPAVQSRCYIPNHRPPNSGSCGFCNKKFTGEGSWDECLEHVGKHYEHLDSLTWPWRDDEGLRHWMVDHGLLHYNGSDIWELTSGSKRRRSRNHPQEDSEPDAECEEGGQLVHP